MTEGNHGMGLRFNRFLAIVGCAAAMFVSVPAGTALAKPWATPLLKINPGKTNCPLGYVCFWSERDYRGAGVAVYGTETDWSGFRPEFRWINDSASSAFNNGFANDEKPDVMVSRDVNGGGGSMLLCTGDSMALLPHNSGGIWADLANYDKAWGDRISSNIWIRSHTSCH